MVSIAIVLLIGFTSLVAYVFGTRTLRLSASHLPPAGRRVLESLGLAGIFLALNVMTWTVGILGARAVTGSFTSVYLINDVAIGILSFVQGLMFQWWRESERHGRADELA